MIKRLLLSLTFVTMISAPALAEQHGHDRYDSSWGNTAAVAAGTGGIGAVGSGAVGSVAGVGTGAMLVIAPLMFLAGDVMINGNDSLMARGVMGLCELLGGEQSPADNYQTCS